MTDALATHATLRGSSTPLGHRVGREPLPSVYLMEDHDEALRIWQRWNFSSRTLLHIDAHIDFDWIPEKSFSDLFNVSSLHELEALAQEKIFWDFTGRRTDSFVHIGNYLCLALREGIVRTFYWVTPEAPRGVSWEKEMLHLLRIFQKSRPRTFTHIQSEKTKIRAELYGFPLIVCTLQSLPPLEETVLLDIDTDFLISGFLSEEGEDPRRNKPWLFPEELISSLRVKGIRSDCVTIAYSVEGGFTPLRYKYLGDALARLIQDPFSTSASYDHKKSAQDLEEKGRGEEAISKYREALKLDPDDAASLYTLSWLFLEKGEKEEASRLYQKAIAADPAYATSYNNFGPVYEGLGQWEKAKEEYERMLSLDPNHNSALCGLGKVFRFQKNHRRSLFYYEEALSKNPKLSGAHYGLGRLFFEKKEWDKALLAFQRSLELNGPETMLKFWIGASFFKKKEFRQAKEWLLEAARLCFRSLSLHLYLFRIYFHERLTYKMWKEAKNILLTDVFEKNRKIPWKMLEGQAILIDPDERELLRFTPVGTAIWEALDGKRNVEKVITHVGEGFEVKGQNVRRDVMSFLKQLRRQALVEKTLR